MSTLVTGAGGLVGRAVVAHFTGAGAEVAGFAHKDLDITDERALQAAFDSVGSETVINCAAWADVDGCESDRERAMQANACGPELLAQACRRVNATLITISTDYVFDGEKDGFYFVKDRPGHDRRYAIDPALIESEVGWHPRETWESGLRKTIEWYRDNTAWIDRVRSGAYRDYYARQYGMEATAR